MDVLSTLLTLLILETALLFYTICFVLLRGWCKMPESLMRLLEPRPMSRDIKNNLLFVALGALFGAIAIYIVDQNHALALVATIAYFVLIGIIILLVMLAPDKKENK